jgi:hypothetical protein
LRQEKLEPPPPEPKEFEEFSVLASGFQQATIKLPRWQAQSRATDSDSAIMNFVVIHCNKQKGLRLMMVSRVGELSERVQVTEDYVPFTGWRSHVPRSQRELVLLK